MESMTLLAVLVRQLITQSLRIFSSSGSIQNRYYRKFAPIFQELCNFRGFRDTRGFVDRRAQSVERANCQVVHKKFSVQLSVM